MLSSKKQELIREIITETVEVPSEADKMKIK